MITKAHRFHGLNGLSGVYRNGSTLRDPILSLKYLNNHRRRTWRAAVVISRKVNKSAVVRNRIRRRVYEIISTQASNIAEPYDIVLSVYSDELVGMPSDQLNHLVTNQLIRAHILSQPEHPSSRDIVDSKEK